MAENALSGAAISDSFDHRGMIVFIRQDHTARQHPRQGRQSGFIRHKARGEQQSCLLDMQVGQFSFQHDVVMGRSRNIAGTACPAAHSVQGLRHRVDHFGVLSHAQIIVRTPDHDIARTIGPMMLRIGESTAFALDIGEDAIAPFGANRIDRLFEEGRIIFIR